MKTMVGCLLSRSGLSGLTITITQEGLVVTIYKGWPLATSRSWTLFQKDEGND